jgi:hypothetical protein
MSVLAVFGCLAQTDGRSSGMVFVGADVHFDHERAKELI